MILGERPKYVKLIKNSSIMSMFTMSMSQENGFHIMLDETSPYIAGWFAATVLTLMLLKYIYLGQGLGEQGEAEVSSIMMLIIILLISFINVIMMIRPCTSTCFLW